MGRGSDDNGGGGGKESSGILLLVAVVGVYLYHKKQVETGNEGFILVQDILLILDNNFGTHLTPAYKRPTGEAAVLPPVPQVPQPIPIPKTTAEEACTCPAAVCTCAKEPMRAEIVPIPSPGEALVGQMGPQVAIFQMPPPGSPDAKDIGCTCAKETCQTCEAEDDEPGSGEQKSSDDERGQEGAVEPEEKVEELPGVKRVKTKKKAKKKSKGKKRKKSKKKGTTDKAAEEKLKEVDKVGEKEKPKKKDKKAADAKEEPAPAELDKKKKSDKSKKSKKKKSKKSDKEEQGDEKKSKKKKKKEA